MKFYEFSNKCYDSWAVIYAKDSNEAKKVYELEVNDSKVAGKPTIADIDYVVSIMLRAGNDKDSETSVNFGIAGDLFEIIASTEPIIVFCDEG
jgi:hypothetical protein